MFLELKRLETHCLGGRSSGNLSLTVHVGADQSLLQDWKQAALGLLAFSGTDVDETVDAGGCGGSCHLR